MPQLTPDSRQVSPQPAKGHVLYPNAYVWLVFVSALDVMFTWIVLYRGGREMNGVAAWVIRAGGLWGMIAFKFGLIMGVILLCETIGRRRFRAGQRLSAALVAISVAPVLVALALLYQF